MIVSVPLPGRAYDILIEAGALGDAGRHLLPYGRGGRLVVVADDTVWGLHGEAFRVALAPTVVEVVTVPPGEGSKGFATLSAILDRLLALGVERSDSIVAFGGGVVGDLAGFAAAVLKRGCGFVQVPTTLLAQVDSSVGGKTGINVAAGKNLVGAFHQPRFVLIDPDMLATLPPRQRVAGYAEVVKYGLLGDADFFDWCETNGGALLDGDADALAHAIATSVAMKAAIVVEDERETADRRALLNLGHTFGHALEAETGYSDRLLHGEAVAAGMALAARYSVRRGLLRPQEADRIAAHFAAVGLPTGLSGVDADGDTLVAHMAHDKKKSGGTLPFLLLRGIGDAFVARDVDPADVAAFLDAEPR